jgi:hypothetical protein
MILEQALGENCQFFIRQAFGAYAIFSRGKKLFQKLKFWNSLRGLPGILPESISFCGIPGN